MKLDVTVALLSLAVVPFLYLCLRYYMRTLVDRERAREGARVEAHRAAVRDVLGDPAGQELRARAVRSRRATPASATRRWTRGSRITWQESLFSVVVSTITILGTALVRRRRRHARAARPDDDRRADGRHRLSRRGLRPAVGDRAHDRAAAGRARRRQARPRDVRAWCRRPSTRRTPIDATGVTGDIRFDDVGFAYPGRHARSCTTSRSRPSPGEMVALVGLTGAGKTTLVSLIPRFYDATAGPRARSTASTCGGTASARCARRSRSCCRIRCCSPGTIADNLRYGRLDATDAEIEEAARAAHAHEFISRLPKGYDTRDRRGRRRPVGRRAPAAERRARAS